MVSTSITWMWNESDDPWAKLPVYNWIAYTPSDNEIIENAYTKQLPKIELGNYEINFIHNVQIHKDNRKCQRQIFRNVIHAGRFLHEPLNPKLAVQFSYVSCYSVFLLECQRIKIVTKKDLKNKSTKHLFVERAAEGIIDEGNLAGDVVLAKRMANKLHATKFCSLPDIYTCAIQLYTADSFLYEVLNKTLRLAEEKLSFEQQHNWTSKLQTLGPYAMILECALSFYSTRKSMIVYRTAALSDEQIEQFRTMNFLECGYFPAFTSCSLSLEQANRFNGNVLFIIELPKRRLSISGRQGLTNVCQFSEFPREKEVIMRPATLFHINSVEYNAQTKRHEIKLTIM